MVNPREFEAASGDLDAEDREPIFIERRSTRKDVVRGLLRLEGRSLEVRNVEVFDPSLSKEDVVALFVGAYLFTLTDDSYRGKADDVTLAWADGAPSVTFPYPAMGWRAATVADDDALVALGLALQREDPGPYPVDEAQYRRTLAALRAAPTRGRAVVLDGPEGVVVGYALLVTWWNNELGGELLVIDELYVAPAHRGAGHGRALIEAARRGAFTDGAPVAAVVEVYPDNVRARALYERLGFAAAPTVRLRWREMVNPT